MFFRFFDPLLPPPLLAVFDLLEAEDEDDAEADAVDAAEAPEVEAVAEEGPPCRACRINRSTTRNVSGSSMSTFSSTFWMLLVGCKRANAPA